MLTLIQMLLHTLPQPTDVISARADAPVNPVLRSARIPLYFQVKLELQRMIAQWEGADGRFFTDEELRERFGVSRVTVRQAVAELVDEGALKRTPGRGTFITQRKLEERALVDGTARPAFDGEPAEIEVLEFELVRCPRLIAPVLGVEPGARVRQVRRLRRHRGVPVRLDQRFLTAAASRGLTRGEVLRCSLVEFLSARFELSRADMQLEARAAAPEEAALLGVLMTDPVLVRNLVYHDGEGRPLMAGHSIYRSDLMRYAVSISCRASTATLAE